MRSALKRPLFLLPMILLAACSSGVDNSEPPAELTVIEDPMRLIINWSLDTRAASNRASYRLRPLLLDDRIYSIDTQGSIVCVDAENGRRLWRHDTDLAAVAGLGGSADSLIATSREGEVAAYRLLDNGLEQLWKADFATEIRASPVLDGDQVFVRSVDGKLRSLAAADGSQQWSITRRVPSLSLTGNSEPLVAGSMVIVGHDDGKLVAFNRNDGEIRWETSIGIPSGRTEVERLVDIDGRFELRDGIIYVASFQGRLAAVQAVSGDLLWSREFSSFQAIAVDDDAIYLAADNSHLWSIDRRTGSAFWKQDVLNARRVTAPSLIDDQLVVADLDGYMHWFNRADGKLVGRIRYGYTRSYIQPLVWGDSVMSLDRTGLLASISPLK